MNDVSDNVKNAYKSNGITKHVNLYFPELDKTITTEQLYFETLGLDESILESESIEFVGCISSKFSIQIHGLKEDIKGKKIVVTIHTDGTEEEPITLFNGIVDTVTMQANKQSKEIVAYDVLYTKGNTDVSAWYNDLTFPVTLKALRDSLFAYLGINQVSRDLPNDSITINKEYDPKTIKAINVIKAVCQINGAFGIINREGNFEYRILPEIKEGESGAYPSITLYPPFYPGAGTGGGEDYKPEQAPYYKSCDYEEYSVKPVDKLTIRQSEDDAGITYGNGTNNYIIQGNMFTYGLSEDVLLTIAENLYPNIEGISYIPFTAINNGYPWVECGKDIVSYYTYDFEASSSEGSDIYTDKQFYVFSRHMSGIQALKDEYSAEGEEYQRIFITDLQTQIDTVKQNVESTVSDIIDNYIDNGQLSGLQAVSVTNVPIVWDSNTIYFIRS